jgi:hypothetical protein
MKSIFRLFLLTALAAVSASAGIIAIVFDDPDQAGLPGDTLSYYAVITHIGGQGDPDIYLNLDSLVLTMPGGSVNDNFFANVPIFLAPGDSSGSINLFDVVVTSTPGTYAGTYNLIGGEDGGANTAADNLAQANFSVTAVPEPGTVAMLCAGLAVLAWRRRTGHQNGHSGN